ncbi:Purinergic receptor [Balamuthia mandrillaris]
MGTACSCCYGKLSWDSVLAYSTVKVVQIRDKRLGLLHYFLMALIIGYIVGYTLLYQKRYLLLEVPTGSVRTSLQSPQTAGQLPPPPSQLPYCSPLAAASSSAQQQQQKRQSDSGGGGGGFPFDQYPCQYWDEELVVFPVTEATAMFIATRVTSASEHLVNCSLTSPTCVYVNAQPPETFFIANIENFTLLIDHSMFTQEVGLQANSRELPGKLVNQHGHEMKDPFPGDSIGQAGKADIIHLSLLLEAAGIHSLDTPSSNNATLSKRYDGIVLLVFITYSNTFSFNTKSVHYEYSVHEVSSTKFKSVEPILTKNITTRQTWNRHGIRLIFIQQGRLGKFDFQTLLLSLVSGLGLLAVATFIVDTCALRLMPSTKKIYHRYKYLETPEYATVLEKEEKDGRPKARERKTYLPIEDDPERRMPKRRSLEDDDEDEHSNTSFFDGWNSDIVPSGEAPIFEE